MESLCANTFIINCIKESMYVEKEVKLRLFWWKIRRTKKKPFLTVFKFKLVEETHVESRFYSFITKVVDAFIRASEVRRFWHCSCPAPRCSECLLICRSFNNLTISNENKFVTSIDGKIFDFSHDTSVQININKN